jgi:hypothetical protein
MSEFSVSFIETFQIEASSREEAIAIARAKYRPNLDTFDTQGVNGVTCEIVPKLLKEKV